MLSIIILIMLAPACFAMEEGQRDKKLIIAAEQKAIKKNMHRLLSASSSDSEDELIVFPKPNNTVTDAKKFLEELDELPMPLQSEILKYTFDDHLIVPQDVQYNFFDFAARLFGFRTFQADVKNRLANPTFKSLPNSIRADLALRLYLLQEPNAVAYMKNLQKCVDKGDACTKQELETALNKIKDIRFIRKPYDLLLKIQDNKTFLVAREMAEKLGIYHWKKDVEPVGHTKTDQEFIDTITTIRINVKNLYSIKQYLGGYTSYAELHYLYVIQNYQGEQECKKGANRNARIFIT